MLEFFWEHSGESLIHKSTCSWTSCQVSKEIHVRHITAVLFLRNKYLKDCMTEEERFGTTIKGKEFENRYCLKKNALYEQEDGEI